MEAGFKKIRRNCSWNLMNSSCGGQILLNEMAKSLELHCSLSNLNSCGCDAKLAIAYERGRFGGRSGSGGAWPHDVQNAPISTIR
jgi:hypothetical protein